MLKLCAAFDLTLKELLEGIPDGLAKDGAAESGITERKDEKQKGRGKDAASNAGKRSR